MTAFLLAALLAADPAPAPAAFVLEVSGAVTVEKAGKPTPLDDGDPLRPGDKITVPAGGSLKVFFKAANKAATLDGPATAAVKADTLDATGGKLTTKDAKISAKAADGLDKEKSTLVGGMTLRPFAPDPPPALRPVVDSAVLAAKPAFEWPAVAGAKAYRFELVSGVSEKKERPVWSVETTESKLAYPDGQRPLDRGATYRWKVTAVLADGSTKPAATVGRFAVLDDQAAAALAELGSLENSADPTDWLLAARAYAGWRLSDEAVRVYEKLAAARPSPGVWRSLAKLYRQAGRTDRAKEAEAKAEG